MTAYLPFSSGVINKFFDWLYAKLQIETALIASSLDKH
jgi:hypothetical protein